MSLDNPRLIHESNLGCIYTGDSKVKVKKGKRKQNVIKFKQWITQDVLAKDIREAFKFCIEN